MNQIDNSTNSNIQPEETQSQLKEEQSKESPVSPKDKTTASIEALLFVASRPLTLKKIAETVGVMVAEARESLARLSAKYQGLTGLRIVENKGRFQMTTSAVAAKTISRFLKQELEGNLTRASLETLAIICYRGPITKSEIESIRGVNSTIILRNLMMRGLIERKRWHKDARQYVYSVSFEFLKLLGVSKIEELPDYAALSQNKSVTKIAEMANPNPASPKK